MSLIFSSLSTVPEVAILFIVKETEHICSYLEHVWKFFYSRPYGVDILLVETTRIDVFKQEDQVFALPQGNFKNQIK